MEQFTLNNISATEFLEKRYVLGDKYYDSYVAPYYKLLSDYLNVGPDANNIFKSKEDMETFYSLFYATYHFVVSDLVYLMTNPNKTEHNREANLKSSDGSLANLLNMLLHSRTLLEPSTKLFLEDLYDLLYRNRKVAVNQHSWILTKPIRDYRIGTQGLELRLDKERDTYLKRLDLKDKKPWNDVARLFDVLGLQHSLGVLHVLIAIWINNYLYGHTAVLDGLIKTMRTWRVIPVGIGFVGFKVNGGTGAGGTGGGTPPGGVTPPGGTPTPPPGGGGTPGGTPGGTTINTQIIIPFATTPTPPVG
jgi:hypothetical protein|nr:MAG TPA: Transcription initiation factor TFIID subunit, DNA, Nuclear [Caudoviricetes sp.]